MKAKQLTPEAAYRSWKEHDECAEYAAKELGVPVTTLRRRLKEFEQDRERGFTTPATPSEDRSVDEIIKSRCEEFERKDVHEEFVKNVRRKVTIDGPVGILHFGDPHLDAEGCDMPAILDHIDICKKTEALFAANVGDTTNNWVGRLAALYSHQITKESEACKLATWFVAQLPWLYVIGGNHDLWNGHSNILEWVADENRVLYEPSRVRMTLEFPNGREVRINARHDFRGHSQWNAAHGVGKAARMGWGDHILVCGHKHIAGYNINKQAATGLISHCIQVATYKVHDQFSRDKGFPDQNFSPCAVTIIDPYAEDERNLIWVFWEPREAAELLKWKRKRWASGRKATA